MTVVYQLFASDLLDSGVYWRLTATLINEFTRPLFDYGVRK